MSTVHAAQAKGTSWQATAAGFGTRKPRWTGPRNPAVLYRSPEGTLSLDTKYDPPGSEWLAIGSGVATALVCVMLGLVGSAIGGAFGAIGASYVLIRLRRKRELKIELSAVATDAIIDEQRRRIAFLTPIDQKARWLVLEFADDFAGPSHAVRDSLGARSRDGAVPRGNMTFVWIIVTAVLLFVGAFGYLAWKASMIQ